MKKLCLVSLLVLGCNKNGWDMSALHEDIKELCGKNAVKLAAEYPKAKTEKFHNDYVEACAVVLLDAINPCVIEYQYGSDSADKCEDARLAPAVTEFHNSVIMNNLLPPMDPTEPGTMP